MMKSDSLYARPLDQLADFKFDEKVANVFPDMINRSVPGYAGIIAMTGVLAAEFYQPGSYCYDLGCSLGASSLSMAKAIEDESCRIIAIDSSEAMLKQAQAYISRESLLTSIELVCDDINKHEVLEASIVVMNFTLQFIRPEQRPALLEKIFQGMLPGGILILSEKLGFERPGQQQLLTDMHHFFKKANGYSELEISQKRQALENVLLPETLQTHKTRLYEAGFQQVEQWYQCFNFSSIVATRAS